MTAPNMRIDRVTRMDMERDPLVSSAVKIDMSFLRSRCGGFGPIAPCRRAYPRMSVESEQKRAWRPQRQRNLRLRTPKKIERLNGARSLSVYAIRVPTAPHSVPGSEAGIVWQIGLKETSHKTVGAAPVWMKVFMN